MKSIYLLFFTLLFSYFSFAQPPAGVQRTGGPGGSRSLHLYGKVVDSKTNKGLNSAT